MQHASHIISFVRLTLGLGAAFALAVPVPRAAGQETQPEGEEVTVPSAPAADLPEAGEILSRAVKAMGGPDVFESITSSYIKSTLTARGMSLQFEMYTADPDKLFVRQTMPGMGSGDMGINGDVAWQKPPGGQYQLVDAKRFVDLSEQAHLFEIVPRLREQYALMRTVDRVEFGGADCYKVRLEGKRNATPEEKLAGINAALDAFKI